MGDGDDSVVPNAGLRDQSFALQWIQQNIGKFGGSKDLVTIFGFSAGKANKLQQIRKPKMNLRTSFVFIILGGASVHYQMLSPMSKGN